MPKYIVLEGIDGAGTTTQAKNIWREFANFAFVFEPSDLPIGKLIKDHYLKNDLYNKKAEAWRVIYLFMADRIDNIQTKVIPKLQENYNVIGDRGYYSTIAYEGALGANVDDIIEIINKLVNDNIILKPDLTIILDLDVNITLERINSRNNCKEKFEKNKFLETVRHHYLKMHEYFPNENIVYIDANRTENEVFEDIKSKIKEVLI
ncbi:MAG: dTMP kinase [Candidatus Aenigmarchaeota archaeon]|nr:dTMP kinase [Candidatus Aenigmarchaeota archaeon]